MHLVYIQIVFITQQFLWMFNVPSIVSFPLYILHIYSMLLIFNECYLRILLSWRRNLLRLIVFLVFNSSKESFLKLSFNPQMSLVSKEISLVSKAILDSKKIFYDFKLILVFKWIFKCSRSSSIPGLWVFTCLRSSSNPHGLLVSNHSSRASSLEVIFKVQNLLSLWYIFKGSRSVVFI